MIKNLLIFSIFLCCHNAYTKLIVVNDDLTRLIAVKNNKAELNAIFGEGTPILISSEDLCDDLNRKQFSFIAIDEEKKLHNGVIRFDLRCASSGRKHFVKIDLEGVPPIIFEGDVDLFTGVYHEANFINPNFKLQVNHWGKFRGKKGLYRVMIYDVLRNRFFLSKSLPMKEIGLSPK